MPTAVIPLVGSVTNRDGSVTGSVTEDQVFLNCLFDIHQNAVSGKTKIFVRATTAYQSSAVPNSGVGAANALMVWSGKGTGASVVTAFGNTNSTIYVDAGSLGAITGLVTFFDEMKIGGVATITAVSDGNRGYFYTDGGALTEITDVDFPPKQTPARTITGRFVHLDDFSFIMCTDGTIWNSDYRSISSWTSTSYIEASYAPDAGVTLAKLGQLIVAFGHRSIQFFANAQNPVGSPLSKVGQTINMGCQSAKAVAEYDNGIAFVGMLGGKGAGVYLLKGAGEPQKISTTAVDRFLGTNSTPSTHRLFSVTNGDRELLVLTSTAASLPAIAYDSKVGVWGQASLSLDGDVLVGAGKIAGTTSKGVVLGSAKTSYYAEAAGFVDAWSIITGKIDFGTTRRKFMHSLRLTGDLQSNESVSISFSDNDYATFSSARTIDMTSEGGKLMRCGTFRRRSTKLTATYVGRLEAMEIEYEVGAS